MNDYHQNWKVTAVTFFQNYRFDIGMGVLALLLIGLSILNLISYPIFLVLESLWWITEFWFCTKTSVPRQTHISKKTFFILSVIQIFFLILELM